MSSKRSIQTRIPQGSFLGPFLFVIYMSDLPLICGKSEVSSFAEDTSFFNMKKNSESDFTKDIQAMTAWFNENKLNVIIE